MAVVHVFGRAHVREQHRFEASAERHLRPEALRFLIELDHQRQVAALRGTRQMVEQAHVEGGVLGHVLGVVEHAGIADDLRNVRIGEQEVGADGGFAAIELLAERVGKNHGVSFVADSGGWSPPTSLALT